MALLTESTELVKGLDDLNLGKDPLDTDVHDKDRKDDTNSNELPSHDSKVADGGHEVHQEAGNVVDFLKNHGATSKDKAMLISKIARDMKGAPLAAELKNKLRSMDGVKVDGNSAYVESTESMSINKQYSQYFETLKVLADSEETTYSELATELDRSIFQAFESNKKVYSNDNPVLAQIGQEVLNDLLWESAPVSLDDLSDEERKTVADVAAAINSCCAANVMPTDLYKGIHGGQAIYQMNNPGMMGDLMIDKDLMKALTKVKGMKYIMFHGGPSFRVGF